MTTDSTSAVDALCPVCQKPTDGPGDYTLIGAGTYHHACLPLATINHPQFNRVATRKYAPGTSAVDVVENQNMKLYVFFREGMFYPIELRDDDDARANAERNSGTLRVEDIHGRVVWERAREH